MSKQHTCSAKSVDFFRFSLFELYSSLQHFEMWVEKKSCIHFAATAKPSVQVSHNASTPLSPGSA